MKSDNKNMFNINIYIGTDDRQVKEAVMSVIRGNNKAYFKRNMKIFLFDASSSEENKMLCKKYVEQYPDNIQYFERNGKTQYECYNEALEINDARYLNFTNAHSVFEHRAFRDVLKEIKSPELEGAISIAPWSYNANGKIVKYLRYKDQTIDFEETPHKFNLCLGSYFFDRSFIKDTRFENSCHGDAVFIADVMTRAKKLNIVKTRYISSEAYETDYYNYSLQNHPEFYIPAVKDSLIPFLKRNQQNPLAQYIAMYLIEVKFACNINDRNKNIIGGKEIKNFFEECSKAFALMDDKVVLKFNICGMRVLPKFMGYIFLKMKYGEKKIEPTICQTTVDQLPSILGLDSENDEEATEDITGSDAQKLECFYASYNGAVIDTSETIKTSIQAINFDGNKLYVDGMVTNVFYMDFDKVDFYLTLNGEKIPIERTKRYSLTKFFGKSFFKQFTFKAEIPAEEFTGDDIIECWINECNTPFKMPIVFSGIQSKLTEKLSNSYWLFSDYIMLYSKKEKAICVRLATKEKIKKRERALYKNIRRRAPTRRGYLYAFLLRWAYHITQNRFSKRKIWVGFDQLFKGGDNAEYFYKYVCDHGEEDNVEMYYVINKDCVDYRELKQKYGKNLLVFNSFKHKLVSLHADILFATRVDVKLYCGFDAFHEVYYRDLFNAEVVCLQHGLTIQRIAQYQNRMFDNTKLYFCVSPVEVENLKRDVYDYNEEQLLLTGAPRYDGLHTDNVKRQILISPTWRRSVTAGTNKKGSNNEYSVNFKNSEYFHTYNSLINDKKLIECAKRNNYKIIYLIHPILSPQIDDFDKNEFVEIIPGAGDVSYEKMLSESKLMLTDHSGVQFDFAYMRKPLVYYHPETLPPQYEEGGLKYETMGFGPVCKTHTQIVDTLCRFMDNDCKLEEEYRQRIENFFPFDDRDNCKRVYREALKYQKRLDEQKKSKQYDILYNINIYIGADDSEAEKTVLSVVKGESEEFFKQNIKIFLFDASSSEENKMLCKKYVEQYPDNIQYFERNGKTQYECYNEALEINDARYLNFTNAHSVFNHEVFPKVTSKIYSNNCRGAVCLVPWSYNANGDLMRYLKYYDRRTDIEETPHKFNLCLGSYFINRAFIKNTKFENSCHGDAIFIADVMTRAKKLNIVRARYISSEAYETDYYNYSLQNHPEFYIPAVKDSLIPFLKRNQDNLLAQYIAMYLIEVKFACNINDRNKNIISGVEIKNFFEECSKALGLMDDKVVLKFNICGMRVLPKFMGYIFLKMKYGEKELEPTLCQTTVDQLPSIMGLVGKNDKETVEDDEPKDICFYASYNGAVIDTSETIKASIQAINFDGNKLYIDGMITNVFYMDFDKINLYFMLNGKKVPIERTKRYSLTKFFGKSFFKQFTFKTEIPAEEFTGDDTIECWINECGVPCKVPFVFSKIQSRLTNKLKNSYWLFSDYIMTYDDEKKNLVVNSATKSAVRKSEKAFCKDIRGYAPTRRGYLYAFLLRWAYRITQKKFSKHKVWVGFDQLFKGGDNAEYFYKYVCDHGEEDNVEMYYIINKNCADYRELKQKYGKNILVFNSFKHRLVSLHADILFATRVDVKLYCGFDAFHEIYYRGLFNAEVVCLQHGLTIQRIAQYQNRMFDNTKLYFCVSPVEVENLKHEVYDYNEEQLLLTGAPRYDGLHTDNVKRQILISPTWRRSVTAGTNKKGSNNEYSVNFKNSEYFHTYNSLINDKKLIECAKRNNYKIIYLIHPILSPQIDDFDKNEFVEIIPGAGDVSYEKMLSESKLMLTDHSGVQFDFVYMRKPLVYYHPETLPPQYEEGGLKYETMGFGPVCKTHTQIVDTLCRFMDNDCKLEEEYRQRIENFFPFDDHDNCKRVYREALKYQKRLDRQKDKIK